MIEAVKKCNRQAVPLLLIATNIFIGNRAVADGAIAGCAVQFATAGTAIGSIAGSATEAATTALFAIPTAGTSILLAFVGGGLGAGMGACFCWWWCGSWSWNSNYSSSGLLLSTDK